MLNGFFLLNSAFVAALFGGKDGFVGGLYVFFEMFGAVPLGKLLEFGLGRKLGFL